MFYHLFNQSTYRIEMKNRQLIFLASLGPLFALGEPVMAMEEHKGPVRHQMDQVSRMDQSNQLEEAKHMNGTTDLSKDQIEGMRRKIKKLEEKAEALINSMDEKPKNVQKANNIETLERALRYLEQAGDLLLETGDWEEAMKIFLSSAELHSKAKNRIPLYVKSAKVATDPYLAGSLFGYGANAAFHSGDKRLASELLKRAGDVHEDLEMKVICFRYAGDYAATFNKEEAIRLYEKALSFEKSDKASVEYLVKMAKLSQEIGQNEEANELWLKKAINLYGKALSFENIVEAKVDYLVKMAELSQEIGQNEEASQLWLKAADLSTKFNIELYNKAASLTSSPINKLYLLSNASRSASEMQAREEAIVLFENASKVLKEANDAEKTRYLKSSNIKRMGRLALDLGMYEKAIDFFKKSIDLDPDESKYEQLAQALIKTNNNEEAIDSLVKAADLVSRKDKIEASEILVKAAYLALELRDREKGIKLLVELAESALTMWNGAPVADIFEKAGNLMEAEGDYERAVDFFEMLGSLMTRWRQDPSFQRAVSRIPVWKDDSSRQRAANRMSVSREVSSFQSAATLALKIGDKVRAAENFIKASDAYPDFYSARENRLQAEKLALEMPDMEKVSKLLGKIAESALKSMQNEEAAELFVKAVQIFPQGADAPVYRQKVSDLAPKILDQGKAIEILVNVAKTDPDKMNQAKNLQKAGELALNQDQANELFEKAIGVLLAAAEEEENPKKKAECLMAAADILSNIGKKEQASDIFEKAFEYFVIAVDREKTPGVNNMFLRRVIEAALKMDNKKIAVKLYKKGGDLDLSQSLKDEYRKKAAELELEIKAEANSLRQAKSLESDIGNKK
jgi:tetratricopeptide (TPR) repeat protein